MKSADTMRPRRLRFEVLESRHVFAAGLVDAAAAMPHSAGSREASFSEFLAQRAMQLLGHKTTSSHQHLHRNAIDSVAAAKLPAAPATGATSDQIQPLVSVQLALDTAASPTSGTSNWFDTHVVDATLRAVGSQEYQDGLMDRNDMINLLRAAEQAGPITSTEMSDLQSIINTTSLFGSLDYVAKLSGYIVLGTTANTYYQGASLGNLAIGSSPDQLEKLIDKWFLGMDHPQSDYPYALATGSLFVARGALLKGDVDRDGARSAADMFAFMSAMTDLSGYRTSHGLSSADATAILDANGDGTISNTDFQGLINLVASDAVGAGGTVNYTDVHQGALSDCGTVASIAELALRSPSVISSMFTSNGDGTYTARFYYGVAQYVTVDSYLPISGGSYAYAHTAGSLGDPRNELWVALAEKAYVQWQGFRGGANNYHAIEYFYPYMPLGQISGQSTVALTATQGGQSSFASAWSAGKSIVLTSYPSASKVVGNHCYAVVGYDPASGNVTMFNPWGIEYGLVTLSWSDVVANFQYFDRTA